jgi:hypothetical protein
MGSWGDVVGGMGRKRLRVHFPGDRHTHHFRICRSGELRERKEVEFWRLRQPLVDSIFGTDKKVKDEDGEVLRDSYFERIWLSPRTRLERIWVSSVVTSWGTTESIELESTD